jgi:hypothetical protein
MKKKHILVWLSLIADDTIQEKAIKNYDPAFAIGDASSTIKDAIFNAFGWSKTPEGEGYWSNISDNCPLREPIKFPSTGVNVSTQEEWDMVTQYYGYEWLKSSVWSKYKEKTYIDCSRNGFGISYPYTTKISFKVWQEKVGMVLPDDSKQELAINKWYQYNFGDIVMLMYLLKTEGKHYTAYGFDSTEWVNEDSEWVKDTDWKPASDSFVEEKLINYAKTNYPVGTKFKGLVTGKEEISGDHMRYFKEDTQLVVGGGTIFLEGKWAEIINKPERHLTPDECFKKEDKHDVIEVGDTVEALGNIYGNKGKHLVIERIKSDGYLLIGDYGYWPGQVKLISKSNSKHKINKDEQKERSGSESTKEERSERSESTKVNKVVDIRRRPGGKRTPNGLKESRNTIQSGYVTGGNRVEQSSRKSRRSKRKLSKGIVGKGNRVVSS